MNWVTILVGHGSGSNVGASGRGRTWILKRVPKATTDEERMPDRQARVFLVEQEDGTTEGLLVLELAGINASFQLRPGMHEFMNECLAYYRQCPPLHWEDIEAIFV